MAKTITIALIGDFNFSYNVHHATNLAIEHAGNTLKIKIDYYWLRLSEAINLKPSELKKYMGFWIVPGPYENTFFLHLVLKQLFSTHTPLFVTGEGFKSFIEVTIENFHLNPEKEKSISTNQLGEITQLEKVVIHPLSKNLKKLYGDTAREELTRSRYSIYPNVYKKLKEKAIDIEAINQFGEPEIVSLKSRPFCVASMSLPQICSIQMQPHPLVLAFINYLKQSCN